MVGLKSVLSIVETPIKLENYVVVLVVICCFISLVFLFSLDYLESKFNGGGMSVVSRMKAWHMSMLRLDKTLTIF
jgi:hypothetical protein